MSDIYSKIASCGDFDYMPHNAGAILYDAILVRRVGVYPAGSKFDCININTKDSYILLENYYADNKTGQPLFNEPCVSTRYQLDFKIGEWHTGVDPEWQVDESGKWVQKSIDGARLVIMECEFANKEEI